MLRIFAFLCAATICFSLSVNAFAQALATDYTVVTKNREYLFVMIAPTYSFGGRLSEGVRYPSSGLYPNNGTIRPIWKVDWFAANVDVSSDGRHLVRWSTWSDKPEERSHLAVAFYRDGKEIRRYSAAEVLKALGVPSMSENQFILSRKKSFDDLGGKVSISLPRGKDSGQLKRIVFDMRTGKPIIAKPSKPSREGRTR